ncbi:hypothetical protein TNIN_171081 [Trichonephila inaurata madagascariensis]|uniref:Uncharacterized protein n=1 Tax=Trichonephila inaurata madagascariensis TaxID=2747483 RepID=A0A8X6XY41_9ARAC|nr:hypothetical protein TNIN_171081 [Trichonephila inaurata madagascariensis]
MSTSIENKLNPANNLIFRIQKRCKCSWKTQKWGIRDQIQGPERLRCYFGMGTVSSGRPNGSNATFVSAFMWQTQKNVIQFTSFRKSKVTCCILETQSQ